jgi:hypothetical protein
MTEEEKENLWTEHCIEGDEYNPTDTMYYEGFMSAIDEVLEKLKQKIEQIPETKPEYESDDYDRVLRDMKSVIIGLVKEEYGI